MVTITETNAFLVKFRDPFLGNDEPDEIMAFCGDYSLAEAATIIHNWFNENIAEGESRSYITGIEQVQCDGIYVREAG